jgi:hypothetical protein
VILWGGARALGWGAGVGVEPRELFVDEAVRAAGVRDVDGAGSGTASSWSTSTTSVMVDLGNGG